MEYVEKKERVLLKTAATDEQAFVALVRPCQNTLYAAAMAVTRNHQDAMDAVQEGILKGWRKLSTLRNDKYFATWLTRIVIYCAIDITRKRKPEELMNEEIPYAEQGHDKRLDVRRAIDSLDEKTRICTVLYYFEDQSIEQIARALGIRKGTVKSRLYRARALLKNVLEGYQYDE